MEPANILQIGASEQMRPSIRCLKQGGHRVFAVDRDPQAPGFADVEASAPLDITDADGITEFARCMKIDVLLPLNEAGVLTAARVSANLRIPGLPLEAARNAADKGRMRDCWAKAGLPQPRYRIIENGKALAAAAQEIGFPCILKPTLNWGSRGVSLVQNRQDLEWAQEFADRSSRGGQLIIEQFIRGTEMTVEGLCSHDRPVILAMSDKEAQQHPRYRVAVSLNYFANFADEQIQEARRVVSEAALALGVRNAAIHCECMINNQGVFLVEMAARPGGGSIFTHIAEAVSGISMPLALVDVIRGRPVDATPRFQRGGCYRFIFPPKGVFLKAEGLEEARRSPGVLDFGFNLAPGTVFDAADNDTARPGFVASGGANRDEAVNHAIQAIDKVRFFMR
jgi:biotin carboxylase